jgi:hypothetical protein
LADPILGHGSEKQQFCVVFHSGAQGRNRTTDTVIFSHVLYQLSYLGAAHGGRTRTAGYRGSAGRCPERPGGAPDAVSTGRSGLVVLLAGSVGLILVLLRAGDRVDAGEPAVEVDVGTAPRAERGEPFGLGLAADHAEFR